MDTDLRRPAGAIDRRTFVRRVWIAVVSAGVLAGCGRDDGAGVRGTLPPDGDGDGDG